MFEISVFRIWNWREPEIEWDGELQKKKMKKIACKERYKRLERHFIYKISCIVIAGISIEKYMILVSSNSNSMLAMVLLAYFNLYVVSNSIGCYCNNTIATRVMLTNFDDRK